jgi:hypothetical protein
MKTFMCKSRITPVSRWMFLAVLVLAAAACTGHEPSPPAPPTTVWPTNTHTAAPTSPPQPTPSYPAVAPPSTTSPSPQPGPHNGWCQGASCKDAAGHHLLPSSRFAGRWGMGRQRRRPCRAADHVLPGGRHYLCRWMAAELGLGEEMQQQKTVSTKPAEQHHVEMQKRLTRLRLATLTKHRRVTGARQSLLHKPSSGMFQMPVVIA